MSSFLVLPSAVSDCEKHPNSVMWRYSWWCKWPHVCLCVCTMHEHDWWLHESMRTYELVSISLSESIIMIMWMRKIHRRGKKHIFTHTYLHTKYARALNMHIPVPRRTKPRKIIHGLSNLHYSILLHSLSFPTCSTSSVLSHHFYFSIHSASFTFAFAQNLFTLPH